MYEVTNEPEEAFKVLQRVTKIMEQGGGRRRRMEWEQGDGSNGGDVLYGGEIWRG